ncbi:MAG TPA: tryptophan--tRNA ligase [Candidatus Pacearchaeota archaeon]|nr:tryptophan--tRNA ligase [Candidatus Pacearchaeota archaeon]HOU45712.1 tryptophan--tRNA ligase [Candidatus Pacearchaeota archaeon]HPM08245.1 tryptophan--tRNA ligase [Candidatus Pacearchaeota archaeon]HQI74435.1 tryptophan--tRNA ligase [Candidatus Pacearchaeota archaeon]
MKKRLLTGDRPSGLLHLGHYFGSLANRIKFQNEYDCYFIIADHEYLTDHVYETDDFQKNIENLVLDYLSVGIDPDKSTIFIESQIPEIAELNLIFSMMVKMPRVQRNPTIKEEIQQRGLNEVSFGFIGWPIIQAADILSMRGEVVPVGEDQLPHIEQTREIARTFNSKFKETFKEPEAIIPKGVMARLPGLDGRKMSKSLNNAIFLSDDAQTVEKKIMKAITDPNKIKKDDKGNPEICNIYKYFQVFDQFNNTDIAKTVANECKKGERGCVECKKQMAGIINEFLDPIREKREEMENQKGIISSILEEGREKAGKEARETLAMVKDAMKINYKF